MDPLIFVALVLFIAVIVAWVALPGRFAVEEELPAEAMPLLQSQQQI